VRWQDEYNPNDAPDRRVRRLVEKDNAKSRAAAKREYSTQVKSLVDYVRRRDRWVTLHKLKLKFIFQ
jgi:hypothetical protein